MELIKYHDGARQLGFQLLSFVLTDDDVSPKRWKIQKKNKDCLFTFLFYSV